MVGRPAITAETAFAADEHRAARRQHRGTVRRVDGIDSPTDQRAGTLVEDALDRHGDSQLSSRRQGPMQFHELFGVHQLGIVVGADVDVVVAGCDDDAKRRQGLLGQTIAVLRGECQLLVGSVDARSDADRVQQRVPLDPRNLYRP
ncbi:hypothetical protein [Gordonia sp. SID5947]|uniref:hypothetical protein n=1 Tax=Gordonia sp. SID5947 TaxID=2690315 RepID=UPI0019287E41|nr:hypothetical protein [Gordonia sp. SID5947]